MSIDKHRNSTLYKTGCGAQAPETVPDPSTKMRLQYAGFLETRDLIHGRQQSSSPPPRRILEVAKQLVVRARHVPKKF